MALRRTSSLPKFDAILNISTGGGNTGQAKPITSIYTDSKQSKESIINMRESRSSAKSSNSARVNRHSFCTPSSIPGEPASAEPVPARSASVTPAMVVKSRRNSIDIGSSPLQKTSLDSLVVLLRTELESAQMQLGKAQIDLVDLRRANEELEAENEELANDMQDVMHDNQEIHAELEDAKRKIKSMEGRLRTVEQERDSIAEKLWAAREAPKDKSDLDEELTNEREKNRVAMEKLLREKRMAEAHLQMVSKERDDLKENIVRLASERNAIETRVIEQAAVIAELQNMANQIEKDLDSESQVREPKDCSPISVIGRRPERSRLRGSLVRMQSCAGQLSSSCSTNVNTGHSSSEIEIINEHRRRRSSTFKMNESVQQALLSLDKEMDAQEEGKTVTSRVVNRRSSWCDGLTSKIADFSKLLLDEGLDDSE